MKSALKQLLNRLDAIRQDHAELRDAEVRLALTAVIYHGFILQVPGYALPESLGMLSAEANAAVRIALAEFLEAAANTGAHTPLHRFAAFQNPMVESDAGHCYEKYFGYSPSYEHLVAAMSSPVKARAAAPKSTPPWWQFWKPSHPRTS